MYRVRFLGLLFLLLGAFTPTPALAQAISPAGSEDRSLLRELPGLAADGSERTLAGPLSASLTVWRLEEPLFPSGPSPESSASIPAAAAESGTDPLVAPSADPIAIAAKPRPGFQWGAALRQSFRFLAFQQGMMLATDKWARWSVSHGKFFADYANAVSGGLRQWDDGDPFLDNYIGHPLQGAVSGFIQIQNDPQGRALHLGKSKAYWKSRLKAMGWTALYSTQFEIGPVSESSIENLGGFVYQNCDTCELTRGAGWVDIVVTPTLGTAWLVGEDALDHYVVRRIEGKLGRGKWTNLFRSVLNPARVAANLLRLKAPWHRDNRDTELRPLE